HLTRTLPAGAILQNSDLVMREVSLQSAQGRSAPELQQLVGSQLLRQLREGTPVRFNDVADPVLIARNDIVTLYLKSGALTLTVKGQALADASRGEVVSVLNLLSNRVVQGIAINPGTVEMQSSSNRLASL
ncbi:MAG TPA: flagellar basal body P-ring formation protein FlgA, partial [Devosia sp.]|nr:flagellar basal body P-ring formation protein FlgA [Devosia sp.]